MSLSLPLSLASCGELFNGFACFVCFAARATFTIHGFAFVVQFPHAWRQIGRSGADRRVFAVTVVMFRRIDVVATVRMLFITVGRRRWIRILLTIVVCAMPMSRQTIRIHIFTRQIHKLWLRRTFQFLLMFHWHRLLHATQQMGRRIWMEKVRMTLQKFWTLKHQRHWTVEWQFQWHSTAATRCTAPCVNAHVNLMEIKETEREKKTNPTIRTKVVAVCRRPKINSPRWSMDISGWD